MEAILGSIGTFASSYAPRGWMLCEGQMLSVADYPALFSLLGTNWGGDGVSTFRLPDLRAAVPVGAETPRDVGLVQALPPPSDPSAVHALNLRYAICTEGLYPSRGDGNVGYGWGDGSVMLGTLLMWAGSFVPAGFLACDGAVYDIRANTALYSLLANTYGGDGRSTFGVPDLRKRVPVHIGQRPGGTQTFRLGDKAGLAGASGGGSFKTAGVTWIIASRGAFPYRS